MKTSHASQSALRGLFILGLGFCQTLTSEAAGRDKDEIWNEVKHHNDLIMLDDTTKEERSEKLAAMSADAFAFYRATAHLFYRDIKNKVLPTLPEWEKRADLHTWISGDFHLQNVGFEPVEGIHRRFDLNDFDEACRAPFHWDLSRFLASLHLVPHLKTVGKGLPFPLTAAEAGNLAQAFLTAYRETVAANVIEPLTDAELDKPTDTGKKPASHAFVRDCLTLSLSKLAEKIKESWAKINATPQGFIIDGKEYAKADTQLLKDIDERWDDYLASLEPAFVKKVGRGYFNPPVKARDSRAIKLKSGLGSLGVLKVWMVVEGPSAETDEDNVVLEAKASYAPAAAEMQALPAPQQNMTAGRRVSEATRQMVINADPAEGFFDTGRYSFHVTTISPLSGGKKLHEFHAIDDLQDYVRWAGVALANAHCRADARFAHRAHNAFLQAPGISQRLSKSAQDYAAQVMADLNDFKQSYTEFKDQDP